MIEMHATHLHFGILAIFMTVDFLLHQDGGHAEQLESFFLFTGLDSNTSHGVSLSEHSSARGCKH